MTPAQTLVWNIYAHRMNRLIDEQRVLFSQGLPSRSLIFSAPQAECVQMAERALDNAKREGAAAGLATAISELDMALEYIGASLRKNDKAVKLAADRLEGCRNRLLEAQRD